ncbi:MAG: YkgJ family cysteine cluster protein [Phycisphaerae bacterium]
MKPEERDPPARTTDSGAPSRDADAARHELATLAPPRADDCAAVAAFAGRVAEAAAGAADAELQPHRTALRVVQAAIRAEAAADALMDRSPDRARRACQAGCSFCCHIAVSLTVPEALRIAAELRATRTAEDLRRVRDRIASVSARVSALSLEERAKARTACALLGADGACTIYEFRPLGCRSWTSLARDDCERAFERNEPGHRGAQDKVGYVAACAVTEGLERGLRAAGLDAAQYEFHSAVLRALDDEQAAERFAAGERVFAGCARVWSGAHAHAR